MDVPHIIAGRFRIECEIGRGGMGTVYRATHLGLERPVAVKIIKPEFARDPDVTDRFMREARTMAKLRHPHAAMIFDAGNLPDGRHFIVMEFVEGTNLSETLAKEGPFSPARAVKIGAEICDVLAEAHQLGIIHRDLKPSNIMICNRGVCVLDFGVAKVLATSSDATATHATTGSGVIIGTPRYMSPEQCLGLRVGAQSDLYSLGVVLYEMLAGRPPFIDVLPSAVLVKQATASPPPLPTFRKGLPRLLELAVHSLLAKRPENRPPNAAAARTMLERSIVQTLPASMDSAPFAGTLAGLNSKRPVALRALTPVLVLAIISIFLFAWGRSSQRAQAETPSGAGTMRSDRDVVQTSDAASGNSSARSSAALPSLDEARRILRGFSSNVSDIHIVRTPREAAILGVHDQRAAGASHMFAVERFGEGFRLASRAMLDVPGFRGANWSAESLNNATGFDQVLYTGKNPRPPASGYRLVLYVPSTRQTYAVRLAAANSGGSMIARWSRNARASSATQYRNILNEHVRRLTGRRSA